MYGAAHLWDGSTRYFVGGSFGTLQWFTKLEYFVEQRTSTSSSKKGKQFGTPYVYCGKSLFSRNQKETTDSCEP